jgi:hypothetical protein
MNKSILMRRIFTPICVTALLVNTVLAWKQKPDINFKNFNSLGGVNSQDNHFYGNENYLANDYTRQIKDISSMNGQNTKPLDTGS